ncbi:Phosphotransferase system, HPr-related protein [Pseudomonas chlororaphis subsp. aurantiaca]|uniref:serine kinase/phosphatase n=1 Tax=Pseudomonas chlororaphis TaxID=587753 RepID=UPI000F57738C|nr:serine kinase/phosphatase [Pseudomonas chlororaphis]AZD38151.1 Phosphotransferase system, HPr-related protein [Pseudomonas chlororaphis subsp. aurantiaca]AZD44492.1 Phosphotransferase system, HPr-related protein [Pseudomonas chlororaphis subsp. aurantiaca]AZD88490.1 Phosphotransferase system, HPr-related protein [Pseudomonas chlororaphis subsp. aureofaciens]
MTESRRPYGAPQPEPIDDNEDRMGSMEELDFDEEEPGARVGDPASSSVEHRTPHRRIHGSSLTGNAEDEPNDDDLTPENLIREDGARSAHEAGEDQPADWDLSIVDEDDIGGGNGLDEAELAQRDPLDGKP